MPLATIIKFFGHLHPVLVHLPIGILLMAALFHFLAYKKKYEGLQQAVKYLLLFGMLAAIASCITGFLLSQSGDYDESLADKHQWFGISVAIVSAVAYYFTIKNISYIKSSMLLLTVLIFITGHLGGTLTHGEGYLTKPFSAEAENKTVFKPLPDVQQAIAYNDIVQPILQSRCYNCHGSSRQKGKLRLDDSSFIVKGGEDGNVLVPGNISESDLIKRILLSPDNNDHMPPKGKPQFTAEQIELLSWWIASGADLHKKVAELNQPEKIKPYLTALQNGEDEAVPALTDIPETEVEKAPEAALDSLRKLDVAVNTVAQNSNYLMVNFISVDSVSAIHLALLKALQKQIIWLKMGNIKINDSVLSVVGNLLALTRLSLSKTNVTDKELSCLNSLPHLQYLNLAFTNVTAAGLNKLNALKNLKELYLYQTGINGDGLSTLKKIFPGMMIDTGGYNVEFMATDTTGLKEPPNKINTIEILMKKQLQFPVLNSFYSV